MINSSKPILFSAICLSLGVLAYAAPSALQLRECQELVMPAQTVLAARAVSANKYLDRQAANWVHDHACVSCHTVVPFVVGRSGVGALGTDAFERIEDLVSSRLNASVYPSPWYGGARTHSSYATESVVNSLIVSQIDQLKNATQASELTLKAFDRLKLMQSEDGSWEWLDYSLQPWETHEAAPYGASLAAVAISRSPAKNMTKYKTMITKMKAFLKKSASNTDLSLWNRMSVIWADAEIGEVVSEEVLEKTLAELMSKQLPSGGWSMNHLGNWEKQGSFAEAQANNADGYATAYTLFILKQANDHGKIPNVLKPRFNAAYKDGVDWLINNQASSGKWSSASLNVDSSFNRTLVEDAATGFALAVLKKTE